jgi:molybdate/tungstate transport system permease protein
MGVDGSAIYGEIRPRDHRTRRLSARSAQRIATTSVAIGSLALLGLLVLPVAALVLRGGADGVQLLGTDAELRASLWLTAVTATIATVLTVLLGTPLAWLLARDRLPGGAVVSALLDLPLLIPHPVAGIALLLAFGRASLIGGALEQAGWALVGSPAAIGLAMAFVAAPLYVSAAREAIARVDSRYESVARTLGDSTLRAAWRVTRPLASRGLVAAAVVMWARAVSEFGAIVILTYNPKVASVLSYDRFNAFGLDAALPIAAVLVLLALVPLLALRSLRARTALGEPAR